MLILGEKREKEINEEKIIKLDTLGEEGFPSGICLFPGKCFHIHLDKFPEWEKLGRQTQLPHVVTVVSSGKLIFVSSN